ncbi:MAG: ABC transporter substrate-binding protein [Lachnospiraceae bacterium]|jgi:raffinose/stachyose/melibiose transport system substrate-binding protein|nr:ABC transporter substrate-binding protein [Lachnospiraceae bacterium]
MKKTKQLVALGLGIAMACAALAACGGGASTGTTAAPSTTAGAPAAPAAGETTAASAQAATSGGAGKVFYLNFKPEQADQWVALAKKYTQETGVQVDVITAASGTYAQTLKSEIAKSDPPTLFQVNGPVGLQDWKDYCYDLKGTKIYEALAGDEYALYNGSEVAGIAYVIETYGIIYNKKLLDEYFALPTASIKSIDQLDNFAALKTVADEIQANKDELGVEGAFGSTGMDSSSDWRFKTHLANLPIYYEYQAEGITSTPAIKGTYLDNYKQIFDLYITDSVCPPSMISSKTGEDAASEFALAECVFYQNGTWAYNDIKGNEVADEDLGMLPIYIGVAGEENQGLCTGSENFWCVNKKAKPEDVQATLDFLYWVISSDTGREALAKEMGFVTPFTTFTADYLPQNPLVLANDAYTKAGKKAVTWNFTTMPSEEWKNGVGNALLEYAQGTGTWDAVKTAFVDGWAKEYAAVNN